MTRRSKLQDEIRKRAKKRESRSDEYREELEGAIEAYERGRVDEAAEMLRRLDLDYPRRPEILRALAAAYGALHDPAQLNVSERWMEIEPHSADAVYSYATALLNLNLIALMRQALDDLCRRFPRSSHAVSGRELLARSGELLAGRVKENGYAKLDDLIQHERIQLLMLKAQFEEAIQTATQLAERAPAVAVSLNNRAEAQFHINRLEDAIASARAALARSPSNLYSLSILARYLYFLGDEAAAREVLAPVLAAPPGPSPNWCKVVETLSVLGDDQAVLKLHAALQDVRPSISDADLGQIDHMAAVAHHRLGNETAALALWTAAAKAPFGPAVRVLEERRMPVGERSVIAAAGLNAWFPQSLSRHIDEEFEDAKSLRDLSKQGSRDCSYAARIVPAALDRGDHHAVILAMLLSGDSPEHVEAMRRFALGQRGSDGLRRSAVQQLMLRHQWKGRTYRFWRDGEWREELAFAWELHSETNTAAVPAEYVSRVEQATRLNSAGRHAEAEKMFRELLEKCPNNAVLQNNLCVLLLSSGRTDEARQLLKSMLEEHPDYVFARTNWAQLLTEDGRLAEAREALEPILARDRLHFQEFGALCSAMVHLELARKNLDSAQSWLGLWRQNLPSDRRIASFEQRMREARRR